MQLVPDLTFSEMNFLANRKERAKEQSNVTRTREQKSKTTEAEFEMSRFFRSRKPLQSDEDADHLHHNPTESAHRPLPLTSIELQKKPFLGFGGSGVEPITSVPRRDVTSPLSPASQTPSRRSRRSTTCHSWPRSVTGPRSSNPERSPRAATVLRPANPIGPRVPSVRVGELGVAAMRDIVSGSAQPNEPSQRACQDFTSAPSGSQQKVTQDPAGQIVPKAQDNKKAADSHNIPSKVCQSVVADGHSVSDEAIQLPEIHKGSRRRVTTAGPTHEASEKIQTMVSEDHIPCPTPQSQAREMVTPGLGSVGCESRVPALDHRETLRQPMGVNTCLPMVPETLRAVESEAQESLQHPRSAEMNYGHFEFTPEEVRHNSPEPNRRLAGPQSPPADLGGHKISDDGRGCSEADSRPVRGSWPLESRHELQAHAHAPCNSQNAFYHWTSERGSRQLHDTGAFLGNPAYINPPQSARDAYESVDAPHFSRSLHPFGNNNRPGEISEIAAIELRSSASHRLGGSQIDSNDEWYRAQPSSGHGTTCSTFADSLEPEIETEHPHYDTYLEDIPSYSEPKVDNSAPTHIPFTAAYVQNSKPVWMDGPRDHIFQTPQEDRMLHPDRASHHTTHVYHGSLDQEAPSIRLRRAQEVKVQALATTDFWRPHKLY